MITAITTTQEKMQEIAPSPEQECNLSLIDVAFITS